MAISDTHCALNEFMFDNKVLIKNRKTSHLVSSA